MRSGRTSQVALLTFSIFSFLPSSVPFASSQDHHLQINARVRRRRRINGSGCARSSLSIVPVVDLHAPKRAWRPLSLSSKELAPVHSVTARIGRYLKSRQILHHGSTINSRGIYLKSLKFVIRTDNSQI